MNNAEYTIVGDTEKYEGCLVLACGASKEHAKEVLNRMLNNPTASDKMLIKGHKNLRIKKVTKNNCWWNDAHD